VELGQRASLDDVRSLLQPGWTMGLRDSIERQFLPDLLLDRKLSLFLHGPRLGDDGMVVVNP
jgi:hypothetical protein